MLVRKDQQHRVAEFVFVEHAVKFISRLGDTVAIVTIDDEDQALRVLEVVSPQRTNLVLSPDIPHRERNVLVFDRFGVETCFDFLFRRGKRGSREA